MRFNAQVGSNTPSYRHPCRGYYTYNHCVSATRKPPLYSLSLSHCSVALLSVYAIFFVHFSNIFSLQPANTQCIFQQFSFAAWYTDGVHTIVSPFRWWIAIQPEGAIISKACVSIFYERAGLFIFFLLLLCKLEQFQFSYETYSRFRRYSKEDTQKKPPLCWQCSCHGRRLRNHPYKTSDSRRENNKKGKYLSASMEPVLHWQKKMNCSASKKKLKCI